MLIEPEFLVTVIEPYYCYDSSSIIVPDSSYVWLITFDIYIEPFTYI